MLPPIRQVVRRHPVATLLVATVVLAASSVAGIYIHAVREWRAAQAAVRDGHPAEARARLKWCLRVWPRSVATHLLAARAARLDLDFESAENHLNRCLQLQHGASEAVQLEFLLLRAQTGDVDEVASALFRCVDENHPETVTILETLAQYYMRHLHYQEAYACLTRWIEENEKGNATPGAAKPYHWRGWVQERLNNHKRAMEDYQQALALDPELSAVRLRVAEMLLDDKLPLEALAHLERLRRQFPERIDLKARLGQCRFLQGEHEEARALLEDAVKEMPKDNPLLLHLAKLEVQQGRPAEAEVWLRRLLDLDPTDTEAYYTLASALRLQGRDREAADALDLCEKNKVFLERLNRLLKDEAERPSGNAAPAAEIGKLLLSIGREKLAVHWLYQALERDPSCQEAHRTLARHFEGKRDADKAAAHRRWLREPDTAAPRTTKSQANGPGR